MATNKVQNICVGEKYTDGQGQEKTKWTTIGKAFHSDTGRISIKLETIPVGSWDGFATLFDQQDRQQGGQGYGAGQNYGAQGGYPPAQQPQQWGGQPAQGFAQQGFPQQGYQQPPQPQSAPAASQFPPVAPPDDLPF